MLFPNALIDLVGAENVDTGDEARAQASSSWYPVLVKEKQENGGVPPRVVDVVVAPGEASEVAALVRWANETDAALLPVGGLSNTTGSSQPEGGDGRLIVAVRLARLQSVSWDEQSLVVTAGAGLALGALEERLNAHRYTLGHAPQSANLATVGGSIATNAVGVFSGKHGRQSDLSVALEVVLPTGEIARVARDAPGPNLLGLFHGAEGTLGIVTGATLRMFPLPDVRAWAVFTFPTLSDGLDALRLLHRTDARPAVVRLFDPASAPPRLEAGPGALLLLAFEGDELTQTGQYQMAHGVCQKIGGTERPGEIGENWFDNDRLRTDWTAANGRAGGVADVLAVSASWSVIAGVSQAMRAAVSPLATLLHGQIGHADAHGAAFDLFFEAQAEPATPREAAALHQRIVRAGLQACQAAGGNVAHHYGVGIAKREFLAGALGDNGLTLLRRLKTALDPHNVLNPGKLP